MEDNETIPYHRGHHNAVFLSFDSVPVESCSNGQLFYNAGYMRYHTGRNTKKLQNGGKYAAFK